MKGTHSITVQNNVLQYRFVIRRNITIIRGNSATGKTTLVDLIREYDENGMQSGISLQCDKTCTVLEGRRWMPLLESIHDSIVFIDEGNSFIASEDFANAVKSSDNYYVIVTREALPNLPYSVDEIYGIRTSGKYGTLRRTYQEFYHIYGNIDYKDSFYPSTVIIEDSNAGYEFFSAVSKDKTWNVISAGGKTKIYDELKKCSNDGVLVVADGAAFGSEMDKIMKLVHSEKRIEIYLPESFEWLILKSNLFKSRSVSDILDSPSDYIESSLYMSWEQFFTSLLTALTQNTWMHYSKKKLNPAYVNEDVCGKILSVIPEGLL